MAETPYTQKRNPKVLKKHKGSEFTNPESNWFKITAGCIGPSFFLCTRMSETSDPRIQAGCAIGALAFSGIWLKYCRFSPRKADKNWIKLWFMIDELQGKHVLNGMSAPDAFLKKAFPLKKIHEGGLIEFYDGEFGILIETYPKRMTDDEREFREEKMKGLVDGLHAGRIFKIHAFSKVNPRKAIIAYLMKVANRKLSKSQAEHVNGILQKVMKDKTPVMAYRNYAFVGLGKHETLQSAEIAKGAILDGIILNMKRAYLNPQPMTDADQIRKTYRAMTSERVIL